MEQSAIPATHARGAWAMSGGNLREVEHWEVGPAIVLVPTEDVLLLAVDLPLATASQRRAALPFALEDLIADPLDAVHLALGAPLAPRTFLTAVVRHEVMTRWVDRLAAAGLGHAQIVPDALVLPVPPAGSWHVAGVDGRILVRTDSGTGFAVSQPQFEAVWTAGGSLPCAVFGPPLAVDLPMISGGGPLAARPLAPLVDLRQGAYALPRQPLPQAVRRAAAIVGIGLLAHTLLLAADTRAAAHAAAARRSVAEGLLQQVLPGTPLADDLDRLLPAGNQGRLLPLLARTAAALAPVGGLAWNKLAWSAADDSLTMGVEAADIGGLQRAQAALAAAGLNPASGAVTAGSGRADGAIVVRSAS